MVAADEVRNAIALGALQAAGRDPEPILQRLDPSAQPIMQMALSSTTQSMRPFPNWPRTSWPIASVAFPLSRWSRSTAH